MPFLGNDKSTNLDSFASQMFVAILFAMLGTPAFDMGVSVYPYISIHGVPLNHLHLKILKVFRQGRQHQLFEVP